MTDDLKEKIKQELIADDDHELSENLARLKGLVRLTKDGRITIAKTNLSVRLQIALYYIGAAYAKYAELRDDEAVPNQELCDKLNRPDGTIKPAIKKLSDGHTIVLVKNGLYKIDYHSIAAIIDEAEAANNATPQ